MGVHEHVVVPLEHELGVRAGGAHPAEKQHLLQRQVEEGVSVVPQEDVLVLLALELHHVGKVGVVVLRRGLAQQEDAHHALVAHVGLSAPRLPNRLPPGEVWREGLDGQQQEGLLAHLPG